MAYRRLMTRLACALLALAIGGAVPLAAAADREATLYKEPSCGCCAEYGAYLQRHGFKVTVRDTDDLARVKRQAGVPEALEGCHSLMVDGYVVEGHVPVASIERLLKERPAIAGISLPGMPTGSPGMGGPKVEPFTVLEIAPGRKVFAVE